nr:MAG TPA: hypothetical protein [Caudoviricetes sp.]
MEKDNFLLQNLLGQHRHYHNKLQHLILLKEYVCYQYLDKFYHYR